MFGEYFLLVRDLSLVVAKLHLEQVQAPTSLLLKMTAVVDEYFIYCINCPLQRGWRLKPTGVSLVTQLNREAEAYPYKKPSFDQKAHL
jgi:hypothetical protein